jgi:hypothetical protein
MNQALNELLCARGPTSKYALVMIISVFSIADANLKSSDQLNLICIFGCFLFVFNISYKHFIMLISITNLLLHFCKCYNSLQYIYDDDDDNNNINNNNDNNNKKFHIKFVIFNFSRTRCICVCDIMYVWISLLLTIFTH